MNDTKMKRSKKFLLFTVDIRKELCKFCYDWWVGSDYYANSKEWLDDCRIKDFPDYDEIENFLKRFVPTRLLEEDKNE